ncbi:MAG: response regulator [bacterium]|nr:response regulator [bacterium]
MDNTDAKKPWILLVDDEATLLGGLSEFLRESGHNVETAAGGQQAIDLLKEKSFTLLVTDIRMPDISGMALLRHTREHFPDVQVILITGYASTQSAIEALRLGAYDYIEKPFEMLELLQAIVNCLDHAELKHKNEALVEELQAQQRRLERLVAEKTDQFFEQQQKLNHLEGLHEQLIKLIDTLRDANNAIQDQVDITQESGKGYPDVVNQLLRISAREGRNIKKSLEDLESFIHQLKTDVAYGEDLSSDSGHAPFQS